MSKGRIIAVANQKGGVAKTTVTHNLSVALALRKQRVLMVDLDSQASLTFCAGIGNPLDYEGRNIVAALDKRMKTDIHECIIPVGVSPTLEGYLFLIPSLIDLAQLEVQMYSMMSREQILRKALEPIREEYDYILLDCPPQLGLLTINALCCADDVLIPCKTDELAYRGLEQLVDTIDEVQEVINTGLHVLGIVPTMYQQRIKSDKEILTKLLNHKYPTLETMKQAAVAKKGVYDGISVVEFMPSHEIAINMIHLADRLIKGEI